MRKLGPRFLLGFSLSLSVIVGAAGCHRDTSTVDTAAAPDNSGPDPADVNLAPVDNSQPATAPASAPQRRVLGTSSQAQPQQSAESYAPQYPPQTTPEQYPTQQTAAPPPDQDQAYQDAQTAEQLGHRVRAWGGR